MLLSHCSCPKNWKPNADTLDLRNTECSFWGSTDWRSAFLLYLGSNTVSVEFDEKCMRENLNVSPSLVDCIESMGREHNLEAVCYKTTQVVFPSPCCPNIGKTWYKSQIGFYLTQTKPLFSPPYHCAQLSMTPKHKSTPQHGVIQYHTHTSYPVHKNDKRTKDIYVSSHSHMSRYDGDASE